MLGTLHHLYFAGTPALSALGAVLGAGSVRWIKGGRFRYPRAMAKSKKDPKGQATRILAAKAAAAKTTGGGFSQAMGKLTLQKQARKPRG